MTNKTALIILDLRRIIIVFKMFKNFIELVPGEITKKNCFEIKKIFIQLVPGEITNNKSFEIKNCIELVLRDITSIKCFFFKNFIELVSGEEQAGTEEAAQPAGGLQVPEAEAPAADRRRRGAGLQGLGVLQDRLP